MISGTASCPSLQLILTQLRKGLLVLWVCALSAPSIIGVIDVETVYGVDEWAGAQELVTALLAEPLSSDSSQAETLRDRWNGVARRELTVS